MRISDWSSDVCSSDLVDLELQDAGRLGDDLQFESARIDVRRVGDRLNDAELLAGNIHLALGALDLVVEYSGVGAQRTIQEITLHAEDRKSTRLNSSH